MENPFETINYRLNRIEDLLVEIGRSKTNKSNSASKELLTVEETAKFLSISKATLYLKKSKGEIPGVCKQGKRIYFIKDKLIDWIMSSECKSETQLLNEVEDFLIKKK